MERGGSEYESHPTDELVDDMTALAHEALSRILELVKEDADTIST